MATSAKRTKALREGERRGFRRFTIGVSEDDLRVIAKHGYEGVASADPDQRAQALRVCPDTLGRITKFSKHEPN